MSVKISRKLLSVLVAIFVSSIAYGVDLSGPTTSLVNDVKVYTYNTGSSVFSPRWEVTGGVLLSSSVSGTTYTANVQWTSAGTGEVKFKQGKQGFLLGYLQVTVGSPPATPPNPYIQSYNCSTQTIMRSGSPGSGVTWYWQTSTSGTSTSDGNPTKNISSNGWYYLRAKNSFGWSSASSGVNVIINSEIPGNPNTTSASRCESGSITLTSNNSSDEWFTTSSGGTKVFTGSSFTTTLNSTTTYYVEAVTSFGCRSTNRTPVTATIYDYSSGGTLSGEQSFCESGTANLSLVGNVGEIVGWQVRSKQGPSGSWSTFATYSNSSSSFSSYNVSNSQSSTKYYEFKTLVQNGTCASAASNIITVTVHPKPDVSALDQTMFNDDTYVLTGGSPSGGDWLNNTYINSGQFNAVAAGVGTHSATYTYTDSNHCSNSYVVDLIVKAIPNLTNSGGERISNGDQTTLSVDPGYLSYQWYKDNATMSGEINRNLIVTETGDYNCTISTGDDSFTTEAVFIEVVNASLDQNYIQSTTYLAEYTDPPMVPAADKLEQIQYFDGLGRPMQTVLTGQSPQGNDIIQPVAYDAFGRETRSYLPYVKNITSGIFDDNALTNQAAYYSSTGAGINDSAPFSETKFDQSPLNRPMKQYGPGEDWHENNSNKFVEKRYEVNLASDNVYIWDVVNDLPINDTVYSDGQLYKNITIDEDGHQVQEFVNKSGQTLLKKVQAPAPDLWALTYYIYDDFGNLRFVMPPEASKQTTNNPDSTFLQDWAFQYKYDGRKRMIEKQVPGAEPIYMIYDKRDRLVLTQDGNQRDANLNPTPQWTFTKYDVLNRPILTGFFYSNDSASKLQTTVDTISVFSEDRGSVVHGYKNNAYPDVSAENDYLTVTYYDDYEYPHAAGASTNYEYTQVYSGITSNLNVKGQVTGTKIRVLDAQNTWLKTTSYYDDKYRLIQTIADNYLDDQTNHDVISSNYDFMGNVVETKLTHNNGTDSYDIVQKFNYDHANRLLSVTHKFDTDNEITLLANEYNELGELIDKQLHSTDAGGTYAQSVDYTYNIRGWLSGINNSELSVDAQDDVADYFGMELFYNSPDTDINNTTQFNGNISGVKWKAGAVGDIENGYIYDYDPMNRIESATYKNIASPSTLPGAFNIAVTEYDLNGNIEALTRNNYAGNQFDNLEYTYSSGNQLSFVADNSNASYKEDGFNDQNSSGNDDYEYDNNGNMKIDRHKGIASISYNHLNLPDLVDFGSGKNIKYIYDAAGIKLAQVVTDGTDIKTTDYVGSFIYEKVGAGSSELQFVQHDEGRLVPGETGSDPFTYEYNLKDHLGNIRVSFTVADMDDEIYIATMETGDPIATTEESIFSNIAETRHQNNDYDHTDAAGSLYTHSALLNNTVSQDIIGPAMLLDVMGGDTVDIEVYAKYGTYSGSNSTTVTANSLFTALASAFTPAMASGEALSQIFSDAHSAAANGILGSPNGGAPAAYLNYVLLDINFDYIDAGFVAVTTTAASTFEPLSFTDIQINQRGYMYIYVSNETMDDVNVHFDDLKVTHKQGKIIQMDDYYPFGGRFNSYQRSFSQPNKYLYNGKEIQEETDWYDFGARMQDPWLGRFMTQDRFSEKYYDLTPYHYAANNPIYYIDVNGDSLNVAQLREFSSDASSALVSDLQAKSGLTLTADANGNVSYAKNSKGKAVVTKVNGKKSGSRAARKALTKLIDSETTVSVAGSNTLSTRVDMDGPDPNLIIFNPGQTQDAINNTSGDLNSTTNGWALTFFHEIGHTEYGGTGYDPSTGPANGPAKQQDPFTTAGRQEILPNRIRRQLGRDYGQRVIYNSIPVSSAGQNYFPWSQKSLRQLKAGIVPTQKFIIHPWGSK